jgi:hypothetical protein
VYLAIDDLKIQMKGDILLYQWCSILVSKLILKTGLKIR